MLEVNMRSTIMALAVAFLSILAGAAAAQPLIVIYNNTPPQPTLELISITPGNHEQMNASPPSVKLAFNQTLDESTSGIQVFDPYSNPIAGGKVTQTTAMEAALPPKLLAGTYRIEWKATCACQAHPVINGTSYFTVY